jgi:hypothetical protein
MRCALSSDDCCHSSSANSYQPSPRSRRSASNAAKNAAKSKTGEAVTPGKVPLSTAVERYETNFNRSQIAEERRDRLDGAPNTRIWAAHVLTSIRPPAAQIGGTGALSMRRSRAYCGPERHAFRSACPLAADDRRRGVCGLHRAAAVALRTAVPSRRARTGSARGSASATEPPGRPGFGRRGSRTPAPGGPRQPRWPKPRAWSSSHRAGAVSAIHSGLLTTSGQNLSWRQKPERSPRGRARTSPPGCPAGTAAASGYQPGRDGRPAGLVRTYRRSGSPATMTGGAKGHGQQQDGS